MMTPRIPRAFVMIELITVIAVIGVLGALLLVLGKGSRHSAWQAGSIANLHEFAAVTGSYQADYADQFYSYSWRHGVPTPSSFPDLQMVPNDAIVAAAAQAIDILRRHGRPTAGAVYAWIPSVVHHNFVLADYLGQDLPLRFAVSPGDRNLVLWSNDIEGFIRGDYDPPPDQGQPPPPMPGREVAPYRSSYRMPLAFTAPDAVTATTGTVVAVDSNHYQLVGPPCDFGGRLLSQVACPSQKVHLFDSAQWQGARTAVYFAYPFARVPMLMVDGSAHVRITGDSNPGFRPDAPRSPFPFLAPYQPSWWDPPALGTTPLGARYFLTRAGITGRDFDGQEVGTSNW